MYVSEQNEQKLSAGEDEEKISLATTIAVGFMGLLLGALLGVAGNTFLGCKGKGLKKGLGLRPARASIETAAPHLPMRRCQPGSGTKRRA